MPPLALEGRQLIEWNGGLRWLKSKLPASAVREALRRVKGHATLFRAAVEVQKKKLVVKS